MYNIVACVATVVKNFTPLTWGVSEISPDPLKWDSLGVDGEKSGAVGCSGGKHVEKNSTQLITVEGKLRSFSCDWNGTLFEKDEIVIVGVGLWCGGIGLCHFLNLRLPSPINCFLLPFQVFPSVTANLIFNDF